MFRVRSLASTGPIRPDHRWTIFGTAPALGLCGLFNLTTWSVDLGDSPLPIVISYQTSGDLMEVSARLFVGFLTGLRQWSEPHLATSLIEAGSNPAAPSRVQSTYK